jgi:hypothetical protein
MGNIDRIVRIIIAVVIGYLYFTGAIVGTLAYVLLAVAAIFLVTSLVSSCPLYSLVGLSTCPVEES